MPETRLEVFMGLTDLLAKYGSQYLQALLTTWRLTAISFAGAFLIGILITVARVSPIRPLRIFGDIYVQIFRNIPGAALLILLVYALPYLQVVLPYDVCVITATVLIPSAFCSEHLMSGMNTIATDDPEDHHSAGAAFVCAADDKPAGGNHADNLPGLPGTNAAPGSDRNRFIHQHS